MRITKVYTRTGDKGTTGLADGSRIPKDAIRIESYGNVDELNSILAICKQTLQELPEAEMKLLDSWLFAIQNDLFNIGSDLATPIDSRWKDMILVGAEEVSVLEKMIDFCQQSLPPLKEFVLPGGTLLNSYFHLARTVCRRTERSIVTLAAQEQINGLIIPFINRLSDLLFVLSRWVQYKCHKLEVTWDKKSGICNSTIQYNLDLY
ncbi:MAG: cob(I)yrinic acid a,c-diamide adenosyltransferase [Bdellovibrionota bacterium]